MRISPFNDRVLHDNFQIEGRLQARLYLQSDIFPGAPVDSKNMFSDVKAKPCWLFWEGVAKLCRMYTEGSTRLYWMF